MLAPERHDMGNDSNSLQDNLQITLQQGIAKLFTRALIVSGPRMARSIYRLGMCVKQLIRERRRPPGVFEKSGQARLK